MGVKDSPGELKVATTTTEEVGFLLTNRMGGYTMLFSHPSSRYQGVFFQEDLTMYKVIENFQHQEPVKIIRDRAWSTERVRDTFSEKFVMPNGRNALIYTLSKEQEFDVVLDCRESYDTREKGRIYEVHQEEGAILIEYKKKNHEGDSGKEYTVYIAIQSQAYALIDKNEWREHHYSNDEKRGSGPHKMFVHIPFALRGEEFVFAFGLDKKKVLKEVNDVWNHREDISIEEKKYVSHLLKPYELEDPERKAALRSAVNALDSLVVNDEGIFAGLPWFFQYWVRDEAVALQGLIITKRFNLAKKIIMRQLHSLGYDGKIPNQWPKSELASADGVGWVFKRVEDFIDAVQKEKDPKKYLSKADLEFMEDKLLTAISQTVKYYEKDGLIANGPKETWMDTVAGEDTREGFRIEIQALILSMYRLLRKISDADDAEYKMKRIVKHSFWNGEYLNDGFDDTTKRPNVFLAYYLYPELLTPEEWKSCFDKIIPALWLDWGGLSSIDKSDPLFTDHHTGENNISYHRGDSWYWINNIAAICMARLDRDRYKKYIDKIVSASTYDLLYNGVAGFPSEISSANEQTADGCIAQAWSASTFIELVRALR